jgi:hypothetical protein
VNFRQDSSEGFLPGLRTIPQEGVQMDLTKNLSLLFAALLLMASSGFLVVQVVTVIKAVMQIAL